MAMVGVIQVGAAVNMSAVKESADKFETRFVMNNDRLSEYLTRL